MEMVAVSAFYITSYIFMSTSSGWLYVQLMWVTTSELSPLISRWFKVITPNNRKCAGEPGAEVMCTVCVCACIPAFAHACVSVCISCSDYSTVWAHRRLPRSTSWISLHQGKQARWHSNLHTECTMAVACPLQDFFADECFCKLLTNHKNRVWWAVGVILGNISHSRILVCKNIPLPRKLSLHLRCTREKKGLAL